MKKYLKSYGIAFIIVAIYSFVKLPVLRLDLLYTKKDLIALLENYVHYYFLLS